MKENTLLRIIAYINMFVLVCIVLIVGTVTALMIPLPMQVSTSNSPPATPLPSKQDDGAAMWHPPDSTKIPNTPEGDLIRYGRELIAHTSLYLGPKGKVMAISNGMNCQNCHLKAGKKPFGNNYAGVASTYPKFRARSGGMESIEKRVNDCIQRSLNGKKLDENGMEMRAFVSYIKWVGSEVSKGVYPKGAGLVDVPLLNRPADPLKGKEVYKVHCTQCHGARGEGLRDEHGIEWKYPPLCDENSYNTGAGLYRLSRFAGYVKANMPYGASYDNPQLSDEEAWDVAAYINSMPRPQKKFPQDWPDISGKPFDHPFGPFADKFSEQQHKYGPFSPIKALQKKK